MKDSHIFVTSTSVFRNLDCLALVVCSNTTLLKLQTVLFLFFSNFCASKSGVRLIYGCGLYMDVYGNIFLWRFQYAELLILIHLDKIKSAFLCKKITVIVTVSISFVLGNNFQFFMIFHDIMYILIQILLKFTKSALFRYTRNTSSKLHVYVQL